MRRDRSPRPASIDRSRLGLPVLLETAHEVAVIKPSGMATELTSDPRGASLLSRIGAAAPNAVPKLPHRLDRVTRGIVVVALSDEAIRFHNDQLRDGAWTKLYLARIRVPEGTRVEDLVGLHTLHLRTRDGQAQVVRSGGKRAVTEVRAVAGSPDRPHESHALLRLHTGRYHQIRATMADLGAPLVDDWLYDTDAARRSGRFYLEHAALRFTPFGADRPRTIHRRDDPDREPIGPALRATLDRCLEGWETNDAEER